MGREIKFRAWFCNGIESEMMSGTNAQIFKWIEEGQPITPLQYTGLKDKNGTELCEGDIINVSGHLSEIQCERYLSFYFWCEPLKEFCSLAYLVGYKGFEIVGNIHENPELMESGDE